MKFESKTFRRHGRLAPHTQQAANAPIGNNTGGQKTIGRLAMTMALAAADVAVIIYWADSRCL